MKKEDEINKDILKTTMQIQDQFPELSKYITEMPVTIPDESRPEITPDNLKAYDESLKSLLTKYAKVKKAVN
ncbi:MAG: hypothetical protein NTW29_08270 [Bacteroidetes bacterium]|nr:hypothetical protein [Bacteroidota bacterium]